MLRPRTRKALLAGHLAVSVGWIGAVIGYLALGVTAVTAADEQTLRSAWIAMDVIGWYAIVPLAIAALLTGVIMALGTPWGLFRHYWVIISLVLTSVAAAVLVLHMPSVTATADFARTASSEELQALGGDLTHSSLGLAVLLVVHALNIYRPRGLTRHGRRRQDTGPTRT